MLLFLLVKVLYCALNLNNLIWTL